MGKLQDIEAELNHLGCPCCGKHRLSLQLQCEPGVQQECLFKAVCEDCKVWMFVDAGSVKEWELWKKDVEQKKCPECGALKPVLDFQCQLKSHECFYGATCRKCGHQFRIGSE